MVVRLLYLLSLFFFFFSLKAVDLDVISVDAYREEKQKSDQLNSNYEVFQKEISLSNETDLTRLLSNTPSVDISRQGSSGSHSSLFLRGLNPEHTLILIDGIVVNDPSNPSRTFNMGLLDALDIEKIEILPGSQGFLHGSDAIAGVINIVTKSPMGKKGDFGLFVESPFGGGVRLSREFTNNRNAALRASIHFYKTQGISSADENMGNTEKDGTQKIQANLKGFWEVNSKNILDYSFQGLFQNVELDRGGGALQDDPNYEEKNLFITGKIFNRFSWDSKNIFKIGLGYTYNDRQSDNFPDETSTLEEYTLYKSLMIKPEMIYEREGDLFKLFTQGNISFENANFYTDSSQWASSDEEASGVNYSLGVKLSNLSRKSFLWEAGLRYSGNPDIESSLTSLLGMGYHFKKVKLRANISSGFKNPSLYQLYSPLYGNRDLVAEKSINYELGLDYRIRDIQLNLSLFKMRVENQIGFSSSYVNEGNLNSKGLELSLTKAFLKNIRVNFWGSFSILDENILRRPEVKLGMKALYMKKDWEMMLKIRFVGERNDMDFSTFEQIKLDSYIIGDFFLKYKMNKKISLGLQVNNILDTQYIETFGYSTLGRNIRLSLDGVF